MNALCVSNTNFGRIFFEAIGYGFGNYLIHDVAEANGVKVFWAYW